MWFRCYDWDGVNNKVWGGLEIPEVVECHFEVFGGGGGGGRQIGGPPQGLGFSGFRLHQDLEYISEYLCSTWGSFYLGSESVLIPDWCSIGSGYLLKLLSPNILTAFYAKSDWHIYFLFLFWPASVPPRRAHNWVVGFQPITEPIETLDSVPLLLFSF